MPKGLSPIGVAGLLFRFALFLIKKTDDRICDRLPLVDLKGIEPSNLTDANRALSQLSYEPISKTKVS